MERPNVDTICEPNTLWTTCNLSVMLSDTNTLIQRRVFVWFRALVKIFTLVGGVVAMIRARVLVNCFPPKTTLGLASCLMKTLTIASPDKVYGMCVGGTMIGIDSPPTAVVYT